MSDLINRQDAIDYIKTQRGRPFIGITLEEAIIMMIEKVPSVEPETPSNGSITSINPEKAHVRTTDDCISRQAAIEAVETKIKKWNAVDGEGYHVGLGLRYTDVIDTLTELPSAEGCKCPCEYREPCDYCHYDAYREHGCPAERRGEEE